MRCFFFFFLLLLSFLLFLYFFLALRDRRWTASGLVAWTIRCCQWRHQEANAESRRMVRMRFIVLWRVRGLGMAVSSSVMATVLKMPRKVAIAWAFCLRWCRRDGGLGAAAG